jgi:hypothetical protein
MKHAILIRFGTPAEWLWSHHRASGRSIVGILPKDFANGIANIVALTIINAAHADKVLRKVCLAWPAAGQLLYTHRHKTLIF